MKLISNAKHGKPVESGTSFEVKINNLRICIHRIVGLDGWFLNCSKLDLWDEELKSQDLYACVRESRKIMRKRLEELAENVKLFCIDEPIEITR